MLQYIVFINVVGKYLLQLNYWQNLNYIKHMTVLLNIIEEFHLILKITLFY
jgi:hypothetical protein